MKNNTFLNNITWNFIKLEESLTSNFYINFQSLSDTLESMNPKTKSDIRRLKTAIYNLNEIKKHVNKLEEQVFDLEEKVKLLEETKNKDNDIVEEKEE